METEVSDRAGAGSAAVGAPELLPEGDIFHEEEGVRRRRGDPPDVSCGIREMSHGKGPRRRTVGAPEFDSVGIPGDEQHRAVGESDGQLLWLDTHRLNQPRTGGRAVRRPELDRGFSRPIPEQDLGAQLAHSEEPARHFEGVEQLVTRPIGKGGEEVEGGVVGGGRKDQAIVKQCGRARRRKLLKEDVLRRRPDGGEFQAVSPWRRPAPPDIPYKDSWKEPGKAARPSPPASSIRCRTSRSRRPRADRYFPDCRRSPRARDLPRTSRPKNRSSRTRIRESPDWRSRPTPKSGCP